MVRIIIGIKIGIKVDKDIESRRMDDYKEKSGADFPPGSRVKDGGVAH